MVEVRPEFNKVYNTVPMKLSELGTKMRASITRISNEVAKEAEQDTRQEWGRKVGSGLSRARWVNWEGPPGMPERIFVSAHQGQDVYQIKFEGVGKDIQAIEYGIPPEKHYLFGKGDWSAGAGKQKGWAPRNLLGEKSREWSQRFRARVQAKFNELFLGGVP